MRNPDMSITCDRCLFSTYGPELYSYKFCINLYGYKHICHPCVEECRPQPLFIPPLQSHDVESFIRQDNRKRGVY